MSDQVSPQQQLVSVPDNLTATETAIKRVTSKVLSAVGFDLPNATNPSDPFPNSAVTLLSSNGGPTDQPTASDADLDQGADSPPVNAQVSSSVKVTSTRDYTPIVILVILALGAVAIVGRFK